MDLKLKSLSNNEMKDETTKTEFSFVYHVRNFSRLAASPESHDSTVCTMLGLKWYISIVKSEPSTTDTSRNYLEVYLNCEDPSDSPLWSCFAKTRFTILSQMEDFINFEKENEYLFSSLNEGYGYAEFIKLDDITDLEEGFIKNDTVKIQVHVVAYPPKNIGLLSKQEKPETAEDVLSAFKNGINEQIVNRLHDEMKFLKAEFVESVEDSIKDLCTNDHLSDTVKKLEVDLKEKLNEHEKICKCQKAENEKTVAELHLPTILKELKNLQSEIKRNFIPRPERVGYSSNLGPYGGSGLDFWHSNSESHNSIWQRGPYHQPLNNLRSSVSVERNKNVGERSCSLDNSVEKSKKSKSNSQNNEEVFEEKTEVTQKPVYFIGRCIDGQTVMYKITSLEELLRLKKQYTRFEILEP